MPASPLGLTLRTFPRPLSVSAGSGCHTADSFGLLSLLRHPVHSSCMHSFPPFSLSFSDVACIYRSRSQRHSSRGSNSYSSCAGLPTLRALVQAHPVYMWLKVVWMFFLWLLLYTSCVRHCSSKSVVGVVSKLHRALQSSVCVWDYSYVLHNGAHVSQFAA